ncbi:MAG: NAD(P)H-dependent oxidoreductase subunit E [Bacillota bacterium]
MSCRYALMERLIAVQQRDGYITRAAAEALAREFGLPLSRVYSIVTFHSRFRFAPRGEHTLQVCTGTACALRGGQEILQALSAALGIEPGGTTPDGRFSLETVACVGACGLAPVVLLDGEVHDRLTPGEIGALISPNGQKNSPNGKKRP